MLALVVVVGVGVVAAIEVIAVVTAAVVATDITGVVVVQVSFATLHLLLCRWSLVFALMRLLLSELELELSLL